MARILVSGLINIETTLRIEGFPLEYYPVTYPFGGVASTVSGVGLNVARALQVLGHDVVLCAMVGRDPAGRWVRDQLSRWGLSDQGVVDALEATPQSVILYDAQGRRQIHVDLKNIQDMAYPRDPLACHRPFDLAVLCNINFNRRLIASVQAVGIPIATDVHAVSEIDDAYNRDFMAAADWLFMSNEHLRGREAAFAREVHARYQPDVLVMGLGAQGALVMECNEHEPRALAAVSPRPVVSTIGAGDALFSGFLHGRLHGLDTTASLRQAMVFAAWKIGCASASEGFLDATGLTRLAGTPPGS